MKKTYHANINKKKARESILISDKVDFRNKKIKRKKKRGTLYNDKRVNSPRRHSNPKCVCTKQQSCKVFGVKTE